MKKHLAVLLAALLCLPLAACGSDPSAKSSSEASASNSGPVYQIAVVSPDGNAHASSFLAGIEDAVSEQGGAEVTPHSVSTAKEELSLLASLDPAHQQGLIALPLGGETALAELSRLAGRGLSVAVVGVDSAASFAACSLPVDQYELGKLAGTAARQYIEEQLGGKATVAVAGHNAGNRTESMLRLNGFLDQLSDLPEVKLTAELDLSDPDTAEEQFRTFFEGNAAIDLIFCTTDQGLAAADLAGIAAGSKAALFGAEAGSQAVAGMLEAGTLIQAAAAQDYYQMGRYAAASVLAGITGDAPPEPGSVAPGLLTPGDTAALEAMQQNMGV